MMKLVACATLLLAAALAAVQAGDIREREGHMNHLDERLGRFKVDPFIELYKYYAAGFVLPNHPERDNDDYRNYLPSGEECVVFFKHFRIQKYQLEDLHKFIVLDACLGWLFDNPNQERDAEQSTQVKEYLGQLKDDQELQKLWENTKIHELDRETKTCFGDLLLNAVFAKNEYRDVVCNNHYLQVYLQFAECQQGRISAEQRQQDSYLRYIYNLLKDRVSVCVQHEVGHIQRAVREAYTRSSLHRAVLSVKQHWSPLAKQEKERMWPKQVLKLLSAFQGTKTEVNQREVHKFIRGVMENDAALKQKLLENISNYATKAIKPKDNDDRAKSDPTGMQRYNNLIDTLCNFFRSSDQESDFDFATPIIRLVQLLNHEDLFAISPQKIIKDMLTEAKETSPIYLSVQACNILTFTEGALKMPNANTKQEFIVDFKPDTKGMVLWPNAGYY